MKKITINSIKCKQRTNISNGNDVFLMVQSDGGPPIRYALDGTWTMNDNTTVTFPYGSDSDKPQFVYENVCYISVWDKDGALGWINSADMLGNAYFESNAQGGDVDVWGVDGSFYSLNVSIENYSPSTSQSSTPIPTSLQESIKQELEAWAATSDGQSVLGETDKSTLETKFLNGLKSSFQKTMNLISDLPWIESVSLGITAQVEIFGGIQGDFGVVMGLENAPNDNTIYGGGAIIEGFEAGMSAAINFGVWSQKPIDVGGFYEGIEVIVTDVVGLSGTIWVGRGDRSKVLESGSLLNTLKLAKAAFLGLDIGLDDGVSAEELYIIAGHIENYPSFQTGTYDNMAVLTKLECKDKHSSGSTAHDNVSLHWEVDKEPQAYKYPLWNQFEMAESGDESDGHDDSIWQCGTVIKFNDKFKITLYIESSSTKTIDHNFQLSDFDGVGDTYTKKFEDGGTEYKLTAKLLVKG